VHELRELRLAIERLHGCKARHLRSEPVHEVFQGKTVWQGVVEVFQLSGHAKAKLCYAWKHLEGAADEGTRFVAVLGVHPINSAQDAVKALIVADLKRDRAN
jgi:hypothetical protein